jgi:acyl-CoA thioester hydrolase
VSELQTATVVIDYWIKDQEVGHPLASTTMAPYQYETRRPRRLTPAKTLFFESTSNGGPR